MEPAKDLRVQGQWVPVTPAKPFPIKRPQPIPSPNWFGSIEANRASSVPRIVPNNTQMGALASSSQGQIYGRSQFNNDGLAQIPYKRLLEINDPAIERQTNLVNFMLAQRGGGVGGRQEMNAMNAETTNRNQLLHGNILLPSNREDVNRQFLPSYQEDVNHQFLALHQEDVNRQFLPLYQEDVNSQFMPLNHEDVSNRFMPPNQENVNNSFLPLNNEHVNSRRLPPLAPKPQYKQPLPFLPNLNSLPEINMASAFVSEAMSSPVTPASMEKNQRVRIHSYIPHEIIDLESDEYNHLEQCSSNQAQRSPIITSQHQEGDRNPITNSSQELAVQQTNGENQNIDLNNTPQQQKRRRRKHMPKVIREGKPAKTPKPATPKPATTTENPSGKRKYVRKNKGININPVDTPSTTLKESVNPDSQSRSKPVRRSLNFGLEDPQAINRSSESQIREANTAAEFMLSSSQRPGSVSMESLRGCGVGIDLNSSTNQTANENERISQTPIQTPLLSRQEMIKAKWREEFKSMLHNMTPSHQSASRRESLNVLMQGTKREYNLVNNAQAPENNNSMHANDIHKKMRIEDGQKEPPSAPAYTWACTPAGWRSSPSVQNPSEPVLTFADAQRVMAHEKMLSSKSMLLFNQLQRQASERQAQVHSQTSHGTHKVSTQMAGCNQTSTPEKAPDVIHGPRARVEALIAHQVKSKAGRPRKKADPPVTSTVTNVARRENVPETIKIGPSPLNSSNYKPSGVLVSYRDPVDYIVQKLRNLTINGGHEVVTNQPQNALVPYVGGGGAMVPFDGPFNILKKRKPRPKVNLDPESNRVWKLLMGKEDEGEQRTSVDKEKWWEQERRVFRGRADSFIARMHLIQGDRRFSRWKGSVVDSVIGVFLTQNVSDHLSSSAFMSLAARFPPKSKGNNTSADAKTTSHPIIIIDSHESLESNTGVDSSKESSSDFHEIELGKGHESPDSVLGTAATLASCTSIVDGEERKSLEDLLSSQNSIESSQSSSECPCPINPLLNFEADELLNGGRGNGFNSFTELLQMANDRTLQDPKVTGNVIDWSQNDSSNLSYNHSDFLNSGFVGVENGDLAINESNRSYLPPYPFELNNARQYGSCAGSSTSKQSIAKIASRIDSCRPISQNINQPISVQSEKHSCCQSEASSKKIDSSICSNQQGEAQVQMERTQRAVETPNSHSANRKNNLVDAGAAAESNSRNGMRMSRKVLDEGKKAKADAEKTKAFDWDSLRRQVYQKNAKKERISDAMDSLDYEALRDADVSEISHTIRERGMNNLLAERIKEFLNRLVRDHGSMDLEWLRDVPPDKAKDYLLSIRGLGLKSVECIRLLTLHHLAFPVDTNVGRITVRLGWVPLQPLPESLQLHLLEMYPILETIQKYLWPRLCKLDQRTLYELHYQLITFGKVFCTKSKPNCNSCPMRGECKHFASAFASAGFALPGPEEKRIVSSSAPLFSEQCHGPIPNPMPLPQLEGFTLRQKQTVPRNCEPIIEEPATPEPQCIETTEIDIEDAFYNDPEEIPTIKLNFEEFTQNLQNYMQENNMGLQDGDMSKALVAITPQASIPMPKLKNMSRLRTEHLVYELPDSHPLLEGMDKREPDDPCPYLLAIWTPGETAQSTEPPKACCNSQDSSKLCGSSTCFSCNSILEAQAQTVRGTILIPCRTANRGSFPLNGTYFQVNEVFADHDSSRNPIDVPRNWIWNLPRRTVYFGTSIPSIFKGLTTEGIQHCFWRGFVCVRGFDRTMRAPKPLFARLHFPASKVTRNKKTAAAAARQEE